MLHLFAKFYKFAAMSFLEHKKILKCPGSEWVKTLFMILFLYLLWLLRNIELKTSKLESH